MRIFVLFCALLSFLYNNIIISSGNFVSAQTYAIIYLRATRRSEKFDFSFLCCWFDKFLWNSYLRHAPAPQLLNNNNISADYKSFTLLRLTNAISEISHYLVYLKFIRRGMGVKKVRLFPVSRLNLRLPFFSPFYYVHFALFP